MNAVFISSVLKYYEHFLRNNAPPSTLKGYLIRIKQFEIIYDKTLREFDLQVLHEIFASDYRLVLAGQNIARHRLAALASFSEALNHYSNEFAPWYINPIPEFLDNYRADLKAARKRGIDG